MAFDGFVISNLVYELNNTILNAKISKIAQPETDELLFTLKGSNGQYRLAMSASASLPFLYLTGTNKPSPLTAPNFCMLLRKHIANGRDRGDQPAAHGAHHQLQDRALGRDGRPVSENPDRGADGQAEQYHFLRCERQNHRQHQARIGCDEFSA